MKRKRRKQIILDNRVLCQYGCGEQAHYYFERVERYSCSAHSSKCSVLKEKLKEYFTKEKRYCLNCGKRNKNPLYCSQRCRSEHIKKQKEKPCEACGRITTNPKFCSNECRTIADRGSKRPPGTAIKKGRKQIVLDRDIRCRHCGGQAHYLSDTGIPRCEATHQRCPGLKKRFNTNKDEYIAEFGNPSSDPEIHVKQIAYWTEENRKRQAEKMEGNKPWNTGLTKEKDPRLAKISGMLKGKTKESDERIARAAATLRRGWRKGIYKLNNGNFTSKQMKKKFSDPKERELQSKRVSKAVLDMKMNDLRNYKYQSGYFYSDKNGKDLYYRSSYELVAYKILEQMSKVVSYEVEPFYIPFFYDNYIHRTIPDILVIYTDGTKELIEVKPFGRLKEKDVRVRIEAMEDYALVNNLDFSIWTEKELGIC